MKLYLVRHGEAHDAHVDPQRSLSDGGQADVVAMAGLLRRSGICPAEIQHSGKRRAEQTATILADTLGVAQVSRRGGLAPTDPVEPLVEQLATLERELMIVGHLPFLGNTLSAMLCGEPSQPLAAFETSAVVCLERYGVGSWALRWMVVPSLVR